ncbi:MAG: hypothetical protein HQL81_06325 [Magnetococcales bacterium]|nr:hypothetical protein [Magnetococcales bacterium]
MPVSSFYQSCLFEIMAIAGMNEMGDPQALPGDTYCGMGILRIFGHQRFKHPMIPKKKIVVKNAVEHFGNVTVSGAGEVSGGPAPHYSVMGASKNLMAVVQTDGNTPKLALWMRK